MLPQTLGDNLKTIVLIHFVFEKSPERVACHPHLDLLRSAHDRLYPWIRSDDPRTTTCIACRNTSIHQNALRSYGIEPTTPPGQDKNQS